MEWIDNVNMETILNIEPDNIEDYTGLPFVKQNDQYGWTIQRVTFTCSNLKLLIMTFDLKYKGRIITGNYQEYGTTKGYHLFQANHKMLDVHFYTQFHPLFIPTNPFMIRSINIFSPNREILQLFLKGIRVCASISISDEQNYIYEDDSNSDRSDHSGNDE